MLGLRQRKQNKQNTGKFGNKTTNKLTFTFNIIKGKTKGIKQNNKIKQKTKNKTTKQKFILGFFSPASKKGSFP